MDFLKQEIFAGLTGLQLIGILLGLMVAGSVFGKLANRPQKVAFAKKRCRSCKWEGPGGPDTKKCPKCGAPLYTVQG